MNKKRCNEVSPNGSPTANVKLKVQKTKDIGPIQDVTNAENRELPVSTPESPPGRTATGSDKGMSDDVDMINSLDCNDDINVPPNTSSQLNSSNDVNVLLKPNQRNAVTVTSASSAPAQINLSGPDIQEIIPSDARKLFLTNTDNNGTKLANMNPILTTKCINSLTGPVSDIQFLRCGSLFIFCKSLNQLKQLLDIDILTINNNQIPVKFSLALADQSIQGKFYAHNLKDVPLNEILAELKPYNVVSVEKVLERSC